MTRTELPNSEVFAAEMVPRPQQEQQNIESKGAASASVAKATAKAIVSREFQALLTQYAATAATAYALEDVDWRALGAKLGTHWQHLKEIAEALEQSTDGAFWQEVIAIRIKRANAAGIFRDASWERLEALAVNRLVELAERNAIRDPGELLAVASAARRANQSTGTSSNANTNTNVNINFGGESMRDEDGNGLPPAGSRISIDLSPRLANSLQQRKAPPAPRGERVIDGEMLTANELRDAARSRAEAEKIDSETKDESDE